MIANKLALITRLMETSHQPVLLKEAIEGLNITQDGLYIDGTFGRGGHAKAILEKLSDRGRLIAIDKDPEAVKVAQKKFGSDHRFEIEHASLAEILNIAKRHDIAGKVDGILLDLGVSSPQLEDAARGFSFMREGPLDMRMDNSQGVSAADWIKRATEKEIVFVLKELGEERFAKRVARAIVEMRAQSDFTTTKQLAEVITKAVPVREKYKHPATRSFQAIRIFINRELEELQACLEHSLEVLNVGGRLAVITFHSLEDRIVKQFVRKNERDTRYPADFPIKQAELKARLKKCGKAIKPASQEVNENVRARSATLRIVEKIG